MPLVVDSVQTDTFQNKAGTREYGRCTAWVNFDGTGVPTIRDSMNVSSITDNGVGDYTVNFAQAMANVNFSTNLSYSSEVNVQHGVGFVGARTVSSASVSHFNAANAINTTDKAYVAVTVFGGDA